MPKVTVHQIANAKIPTDNKNPITKTVKLILVIVFKNVPLKEDYLGRWIFGFCIPTREKARAKVKERLAEFRAYQALV